MSEPRRASPKRPTVASRKKVNVENLARLGAERLAEILIATADVRPELKRRLRMELAAEQGAEHLLLEIDKRLTRLLTSRTKVSWRQRPGFVRDLDALRLLIVERLAVLDGAEALDRMWRLLDAAHPIGLRVRDKDGVLAAVFQRAAGDVGRLLAATPVTPAPEPFIDAVVRAPGGWAAWLPAVLGSAPAGFAAAALRELSRREGPSAAWLPIARQLADAAGDADAYRSTFTPEQLATSRIAADVARRLLGGGRVEEAGRLLEAARPSGARRRGEFDDDWATVWIEYLDRSGQVEKAQAARWSAFERSLSLVHAKAFVARLTGFDDVEAESRAFARASTHADFQEGLRFLMAWPALREAAEMIQARSDEAQVAPEDAELWAARLRSRYPAAAERLLRKAAALAFRRREFATCERLTAEADSIGG